MLLLGLLAAPAFAGPPFKTDDPQPVDLGHLELYLFGAAQWRADDNSGVGPALEFNYGILPDTQFHLILPMSSENTKDTGGRSWLGDMELGIKFRFLHETDVLPQVGVFPIMEIPTSAKEKEIRGGHTQVYLPVWLQKSWGSWTTYGGYGWWRNPGEGQRNWSYTGWLLQRDISEQITVGGEIFRNTAPNLQERASSGFNLGAIVNFTEKHHLLISAGRNVSGERETHLYVGYQFTTGTFGNLRDWFRRGRAHI